jgi:hypothetical protein
VFPARLRTKSRRAASADPACPPAAVAGAVILALQNMLGAIPPQWEGVANAALMLVVAVLAAVGLLRTLRKARAPGFRK